MYLWLPKCDESRTMVQIIKFKPFESYVVWTWKHDMRKKTCLIRWIKTMIVGWRCRCCWWGYQSWWWRWQNCRCCCCPWSCSQCSLHWKKKWWWVGVENADDVCLIGVCSAAAVSAGDDNFVPQKLVVEVQDK